MADREIPAALRRAGLTSIQHDLPAGMAVNFQADFARIFKEDIQRRGQVQPAAASNSPKAER